MTRLLCFCFKKSFNYWSLEFFLSKMNLSFHHNMVLLIYIIQYSAHSTNQKYDVALDLKFCIQMYPNYSFTQNSKLRTTFTIQQNCNNIVQIVYSNYIRKSFLFMNFAEYNQLSLDLLSWNTKVSLSLSCFPLTITTEPEHTKFYNQLIYYLSPKINEDKLLLQCTYNVLYNFRI